MAYTNMHYLLWQHSSSVPSDLLICKPPLTELHKPAATQHQQCALCCTHATAHAWHQQQHQQQHSGGVLRYRRVSANCRRGTTHIAMSSWNSSLHA